MGNSQTSLEPQATNPFETRDKEAEIVKQRMAKVKHKVAIISGKGGVGKSLVTVNLAAALAARGETVGILDADIHGPCVPKMLGLKGCRLMASPAGIFPAVGPLGIKVVSMGFLLPDDESPVIWRGPVKMGAIRQFLGEVAWGNLDYLLIDLPPGTGDEPLSIIQLLPDITGVVIVTIPSQVSQDVVKKAVTFARRLNAPIIGIVENMGTLVCPGCGEEISLYGGHQRVAAEMGVTTLGSIPFDPAVANDSDSGTPFVMGHPDSVAAQAFLDIVERIRKFAEGEKD